MYTYVSICTCVQISIPETVYGRMCMHVYMYIYVYMYMYICMCTCIVCVRVCVCMCTCTYTQVVHLRMHMPMYEYICICEHVCTHVCMLVQGIGIRRVGCQQAVHTKLPSAQTASLTPAHNVVAAGWACRALTDSSQARAAHAGRHPRGRWGNLRQPANSRCLAGECIRSCRSFFEAQLVSINPAAKHLQLKAHASCQSQSKLDNRHQCDSLCMQVTVIAPTAAEDELAVRARRGRATHASSDFRPGIAQQRHPNVLVRSDTSASITALRRKRRALPRSTFASYNDSYMVSIKRHAAVYLRPCCSGSTQHAQRSARDPVQGVPG